MNNMKIYKIDLWGGKLSRPWLFANGTTLILFKLETKVYSDIKSRYEINI